MEQPKICYKTITPEVASVLLRRSKRKNVPIKKSKIDQYARAMIANKWDCYNSQAVSIDTDENIVNGHQRLMACVQAGVQFKTLFITGVPPETFVSEDTGRSRDAGHFFAVLGEKNYVALAAGARALFLWERGLWRYAGVSGGSGASPIPITYEDLQEEVKRRPSLREGAEFYTQNTTLKGRFPTGMVTALYALTSKHPKHEAFWDELADRLSTDKESPAWQLNRRIDLAKSKNLILSKMAILALLTKAWNIYIQDTWIGLSWTGNRGEKMPEPITDLKPALMPAKDDSEIITTTPKKRHEAPEGPPTLRVVPKPEKKPRVKKGMKLRGGLGV